MFKLHLKPSGTQNKKHKLGSVDFWKLNNISSLDVSHHTIAAGKETIVEDKHDRILIAVEAFGTILDTKQIVRDGSIIEIPAGTSLRFQGQMKYYLIKVNN